jgi:flagellar biosynthesis protein FliQ
MDTQIVLTLVQNALLLLLTVASPVLAAALAVGLGVSLFQAVTQINEATLSFVPKLLAAIAVFAVAGSWMVTTMVDFIRRILESIPTFAV